MTKTILSQTYDIARRLYNAAVQDEEDARERRLEAASAMAELSALMHGVVRGARVRVNGRPYLVGEIEVVGWNSNHPSTQIRCTPANRDGFPIPGRKAKTFVLAQIAVENDL